MELLLEVLDGELKGTRLPIRNGLTVGRKEGLLTIRDSKLSSKHAVVQQRPDGSLWMVDAGSSNGIKVAIGRVRELKLEPGVTFTLGRTSFIVAQGTAEEIEAIDLAPPTVTRTWKHLVADLAKRAQAEAKPVKSDLAVFNPALRLQFTRGIQYGTEWLVGYGPRAIGAASMDLALEDVGLPPVCFRVLPKERGVLFVNESVQGDALVEVKLNGRWIEREFLREGDVIEIGNTQIQVGFDAK